MSEYERIIEHVNGMDDISTIQLQIKFDLSYEDALEYRVQLITDGYLTLNIIECSNCQQDSPQYKYQGKYYCEDCMLNGIGVTKTYFTDFYFKTLDGNYIGSSDDYYSNEIIKKELGSKVEYNEYGFD